jgi:hypothetical protein
MVNKLDDAETINEGHFQEMLDAVSAEMLKA